jgi:hypothetical protein
MVCVPALRLKVLPFALVTVKAAAEPTVTRPTPLATRTRTRPTPAAPRVVPV